MNPLEAMKQAELNWQPPQVPEDIPQGDTPGDKIWIGPQQIEKANTLFPKILPMLREAMEKNPSRRAVITVCGGSGVGKTGISSLLAFYLNQLGVGAYTLSGDNYPRRIPSLNDAERFRIFRAAGVDALVAEGLYTPETAEVLKNLQEEGLDPQPKQAEAYPWMEVYQAAGRKELDQYLGNPVEQEYDRLESVLTAFKKGENKLWLKRLGREETALWFDEKDFTGVSVIILEWTHGNSGKFQGVDIPILLNSTPAETREYRLLRARDANTDTPFIAMVLELEQAKLEARAHAARIILSKAGKIISYDQFKAQMDANR
ncbi:adenylylsulfate kinase [Acutalibacter sp. 1XD8-33]|uniref:adenylylsulfate kinase n=1 Tax=Acutalibacter sp. 1XD8-33 TaxID=2320081 RepID=UPI000EA01BDD|nr:adenylylsulfate kinase [Acutalibacter sp. 1XD8-33]RKJ41377.1 adenylylsulfate kinase [Acutalibacter sp. 1XD8-33]